MSGFDPEIYKRTTRTQWQEAAEAWYRWGPTIEEWLAPATQRMLDAAGITAGSRVLDVAAGAGGQSLAAARRDAGWSPRTRATAAWTEIAEALGQFEGPEGFVAPCEMLVVSGTR
jgi:cyclopropane fatty-acyl-phospholipid synthase-like methyltransferase